MKPEADIFGGKMSFPKWLVVSLLLLSIGIVAAQDTCPAIVQEALDSLDKNCGTVERNQACYGNVALTATPQSNAVSFQFNKIGDIANLSDINTLDLEPMDESAGKWGLVLMQVQADIPDTLPGQNITFVLFGDVTIQNAAQDGQKPMQAFYLTTGIGDSNCAQAPESGVMVQTPAGVQEVAFNVNGVDVEMGSTVIFQAKPGKEMRVKTVEGKALLKVGGKTIPVVQGSEYTAPIDDNFGFTGDGTTTPYDTEDVEALPVEALQRDIEIAPPLTEEQIQQVNERLAQDEPLCSDEADSYLPPCTRPLYDAQGHEIQLDDNGNIRLVDENGNPLVYDDAGQPITSADDYYRFLNRWAGIDTVTDPSGRRVEVGEDGTVSFVDENGNTIVATRDGTYTYIGADGETRPVNPDDISNGAIFDRATTEAPDEDRPVVPTVEKLPNIDKPVEIPDIRPSTEPPADNRDTQNPTPTDQPPPDNRDVQNPTPAYQPPPDDRSVQPPAPPDNTGSQDQRPADPPPDDRSGNQG